MENMKKDNRIKISIYCIGSLVAAAFIWYMASKIYDSEKIKGEAAEMSSKMHHTYVDLGLSVKWATCNVGAITPEQYGDKYAWGETEPKKQYLWRTYKHCRQGQTTLTKYCTDKQFGKVDGKTRLDPCDDVAHVKWGGEWRMPTYEEILELQEKCTWTECFVNGVQGYKIKSKVTGNYIFLPEAGFIYNSRTYDKEHESSYKLRSNPNGGIDHSHGCCHYWTSTLDSSWSPDAKSLIVGSRKKESGLHQRAYGRSVRPVHP